MNEKLLALKKKLTDNKTVVIAATTGVLASGVTAYVMHKYVDSKTLIELTPRNMEMLRNGAVGRVIIEGIDVLIMRNPEN